MLWPEGCCMVQPRPCWVHRSPLSVVTGAGAATREPRHGFGAGRELAGPWEPWMRSPPLARAISSNFFFGTKKGLGISPTICGCSGGAAPMAGSCRRCWHPEAWPRGACGVGANPFASEAAGIYSRGLGKHLLHPAQGALILERALALGREEPSLLCLSSSLLCFTCPAALSSGPGFAVAAIVPCVIGGG